MARFPTLAVVFLIAFGLRLAHVLEIRTQPVFEAPLVDAQVYDETARAIVRDGMGALELPFYQPPLYPLLLSGLYSLTGSSYLAPRVFQALLGAITTWLVFLIASRSGGPRAGWIAAGLLAAYGPVLYFEGELLPPTLVLFLGTAALWIGLRAVERRSLPGLVAAGLLLGISSAARPTGLLLAAAFSIWWIREDRLASVGRRLASITAFSLAVLLPIAPFTLANLVKSNEAILVSHNGGINFYLGNGANSDSLTAIQPGHAWDRLQVDPHRAGVHSRAEESRYWVRRAWSEASDDPGAWFAALGRKIVRLFDARETPRNLDYEVWRRESAVLSLPLVGFALVAPLAVLGLAFGVRGPTRRLLTLALVAVAAQNLLFFVTGRYRLEAVPILCVLAGGGVGRALDVGWRAIPRRAVGVAAVIAAFVTIDWLGERGIDSVRAELYRGLALRRAGLTAGAERSFREALRLDGRDPDAHRLLADLLLEQNELGRAIEHYDRSLGGAPDYMMALLGKAQALERAGRRTEAETAYRRALETDPWSFEVRLNFGVFLAVDGRTHEARRMFQEGLRLAPGERRLQANLANLNRLESGQK